MEFAESFKSFFKGADSSAKEVPIVNAAMQSLYDEPWADVASTTRFTKPEIELTPLPKGLPTEEELSGMSEISLIALRKKYSEEHNVQNYLAPFEHKARTKEAIGEAPFGILGGIATAAAYSLMVPVYAEAKKNRVIPTDKETSTNIREEIRQGYSGIGEGLKELLGISSDKNKDVVSEGKVKYTLQQEESFAIKERISNVLPKLIFAESSGVHIDKKGNLISSEAGAKGITQILPRTAKNPGYGVEPIKDSSQEEYIRFTKDYLFAMMNKFNDMEKAVAAYNAGPTAVERAINKGERKKKDWKVFLPKETQNYINKLKE